MKLKLKYQIIIWAILRFDIVGCQRTNLNAESLSLVNLITSTNRLKTRLFPSPKHIPADLTYFQIQYVNVASLFPFFPKTYASVS